MDFVIVIVAALIASGLTLFSGFGLGTLLLPVFALLFPLEVAVAATAVVHLLNNIFKSILIGRHADWQIILRFGIAAGIAAIAGASVLDLLAGIDSEWQVDVAGMSLRTNVLGVVIGGLIVLFSLFDLVPTLKKFSVSPRLLPVGGLISGFFGGLSGNQGAFRAAFLAKLNLDRNVFIGTGTVIAMIVDVARLSVYGTGFLALHLAEAGSHDIALLGTAVLAAFSGAFIGVRLIGKTTMAGIRRLIGIMMLAVGLGLMAGLI